MRQLLNSDLEVLVESGFIYMPLLFDPEVEREIQTLFKQEKSLDKSTSSALKTIIRRNDNYFVKGLEIHSLLENFKAINAYDYEHLRNDCLKKYHLLSELDDVFFDFSLCRLLENHEPGYKRSYGTYIGWWAMPGVLRST